MKRLKKLLFFLMLVSIAFFQSFTGDSLAARPYRLIVDGKEINPMAEPRLEDERILVAIRPLAESLGAEIEWIAKDRKIIVKREGKLFSVRVESRLASYGDEGEFKLLDRPVEIRDGHSYLPLNFLSQALDIYTEQDDLNRIIYIDSSKGQDMEAEKPIRIRNIKAGEVISGKRELQVEILDKSLTNAKEIAYMLVEEDGGQGHIVARGSDIAHKYIWIPSLKDKGEKLLVAAIYDGEGKLLAGDVLPVKLDLQARVALKGVKEGQVLRDQVSLGLDINFIANYVNYEITKLDTGQKLDLNGQMKMDPYGQYTWQPMVKDNGNYMFKAIAYDEDDRPHESQTILGRLEVSPKIELLGVKEGQDINGPVNLIASRNFDVSKTIYIVRDPKTAREEILKELAYGGYTWFPGPEFSGEKELLVGVVDTRGKYHQSQPVKVRLLGEPLILLEGVGPNQLLNSPIKLSINSNVELKNPRYILRNLESGDIKYLDNGSYNPVEADAGYWNIQALGSYKGKEIKSLEVPVRVYLGESHRAKAVIEKDKFLGMASELARVSWEKTAMSAALQTAQSILETGWGQSVPVDKYSGQESYNLFGIKGEGPAGSVTYNTWEVYNNKTYYVDADFRAYNNIEESWDDHKNLLLKAERYEAFRDVMHNSTQGAWALKRSGYATDPDYALKLIRLIRQYELDKLDRVKI